MKILSFCILFILILLAQSSYSQYAKIDLSSISEDKKNEVYNLAYQILTTCNEAPKLKSKNATLNFRKYYDEVRLARNCKWQEERYGDVTSVVLEEVIFRNDKNVYRYKVKRSKADWLSEIRIFIDEKGKYSSINTKNYWADKFYSWSDNPKPIVVNTELVDDSIIKRNNEFALKSFDICEETELYSLNETNAIYRTIREVRKKQMLEQCRSIKRKYGNFKNLKFIEYLTDSISLKIYRYQVDFDSLKKPSEIRIYSRLNDKYSGIFVLDVWYDQYFSLKKANEKSRNELGN
ncbi:hypothetical protein [Xanthomarina sp. F2636L]|uniref:hypothetical protein n=1 Tax=Xanthomarina sp. F2636L TaxID=2996018 RepID=UPI00225DDC83|nr:hypothetical protein [Xanthomarina sp. F2636L]MCX7549720.1 hypothetical protein [Xanthomarina sp. F2636L]